MAKKKPTSRAKPRDKRSLPQPVTAAPDVVQDDDPGDDVQRRFRYQHAYGAILLIGAALQRQPYRSIWCEHHDDFLAKRNGVFDSFQVKTAKPEHGTWTLSHIALKGAIKKCVSLNARFPSRLGIFHFVSNHAPLDSRAANKLHLSPLRLQEAVRAATSIANLGDPFLGVVTALATEFECAPDEVFAVLVRFEYVKGPSLDDFEAAVSVNHVAHHPSCASLTHSALHAVRDEIIQRVYDASSRTVDDPAKHWCCINGAPADNPFIQMKEISVEVVLEIIEQRRGVPFRFAPMDRLLPEAPTRALSVFEKKLLKGGLANQLETMRRRTLSAEQHLLELTARDPSFAQNVQLQLENVVQGICDDARAMSDDGPTPYGLVMYREVQQRLRDTAEKRAEMVLRQEYECLVGVAGLLTEGCSVWWSEAFDVGADP